MGSILRVPLFFGEPCGELVDDLVQNNQVVLVGAVAETAARAFDREPRPDRIGLVLGDEDDGNRDRNGWDGAIKSSTIPMRSGAGSLNVAVAAGILIQALTRDLRADDGVRQAGRDP